MTILIGADTFFFALHECSQGMKNAYLQFFYGDGAYSGAFFLKKDHIIYEMDDV